jgi:hypothetical protein
VCPEEYSHIKHREDALMPAGFSRQGGILILRIGGINYRSLLPCEMLHPRKAFGILVGVRHVQCCCESVIGAGKELCSCGLHMSTFM